MIHIKHSPTWAVLTIEGNKVMSVKVGVWYAPEKDSWGKRPVYVKRYDDNDFIWMVVRADYKCSPIVNKSYRWVHIGYRVYMLGKYKGRKLYKTLSVAKMAADNLALAILET